MCAQFGGYFNTSIYFSEKMLSLKKEKKRLGNINADETGYFEKRSKKNVFKIDMCR